MPALAIVTNAMLVGQLRKELSYQWGMEMAQQTKRLQPIAKEAQEIKVQRQLKRANMKFLGAIPTREFFRIQQQHDKDFFRSRKNVYKLLRDNPALKGGVGV